MAKTIQQQLQALKSKRAELNLVDLRSENERLIRAAFSEIYNGTSGGDEAYAEACAKYPLEVLDANISAHEYNIKCLTLAINKIEEDGMIFHAMGLIY